jgi:hypothetical protein
VLDQTLRRFTYANVMSTLAVVIALGGTSYAALSLTGRDIRNGSLTGRDLKADSLGSKPIKESRLSTVRHARNADRLNGIPAARLFVRCPRGTVPISNTCIETAVRPPVPYGTAAAICEGVEQRTTPGRRLPSHDELMTALGDYDIVLASGGELTRNVYPSSTDPGRLDVLFINDSVGGVGLTSDTAAGAKPFRCVADPLN